MKRIVVTMIAAALLVSVATAQLARTTTPPPMRELGYSWTTGGQQFLLNKLATWEITFDLIVIPKFGVGHGAVWGVEVREGLSLGEFREIEVWGYELYGFIPIIPMPGGKALQLRAASGPMMDQDNVLSWITRIELNMRF